ncbi:S-layer homology domain-containing protein [Deinococcus hopiensis]|nr:S-layer homology domain-containing protein [Deinococcus hopiensis]
MKKSLIVLTAALSFGFAAAQTAAPASAPQVPTLTDVPAGHWAKDAIDRLVGKGIILGYPDGTFRGTQNLTRYEAAVIIARLLDQMRTGEVTVQPGNGITQEDLTALQNAIQELAADLTALGVRVSDLEENAVNRDDFSRLEARVEELAAAANTGEEDAISSLTTQITDLTTRVDELGGNYDELRADVDDNASSIAALNDLTVLLNQDILNLQDRVSAVEAAQADFVTRADFDNITGQLSGRIDATNTRVGGVETRVTTLENAPKFSVVGSVAPSYGYLTRLSGDADFDVDRLTNGTFADGVFSDPAAGKDVTDGDINDNRGAGSFTFGVRATNLTTTTGSLVVRNAGVDFGTTTVNNTTPALRTVITLRRATASGTIGGQEFDVSYAAYGAPAGRDFKFSDYLFNNTDALAGNVFVGNLNATTLPLQPRITVVAGNTTSAAVAGAATTGTGTPFAGVRAAVKPNADSTFAVSYATGVGNRSALGTDYNLKFGAVSVKGEGVLSVPNSGANNVLAGGLQRAITNGNRAFYTEVRADLGVAKFGVNFRAVDPAFALSTGNYAGLSVTDSMPYKPNQVGFGGALGTNLGPIALGAYADSYVPYTGGTRTTAFGVKAGVKLAALELVGFYNRGTVGNAVQESVNNGDLAPVGMGISDVPLTNTSTFGARLRHDGSADNALVKNLNFTIQDGYYYSSRTNDFQAYADYSTTVGGLTLQPLVRYHMKSNASTDVSGEGTTFKAGVKLSTAPFAGVPFQPSFYGNVVYRTTNPVATTATTTELLAQTGLAFNEFLAANTSARIGYSYYEGRNLANAALVGDTNDVSPFSAADDRVYNAATGTNSARVQGVYGQLGYNGLNANYGVFRYTNIATGAQTVAQGFKVSYTFKF